MLELRPNCECCDKDLPPDSPDARICSYECTFCATCVEDILENVCPNCGGGFMPRPVRPNGVWRPTTGLGNHPASDRRRNTKYSEAELREFVAPIKIIEPNKR